MPTAVSAVTREHVEAWLVELTDLGQRPAMVSNCYRSLHSFFAWLLDEGEMTRSPMEIPARSLKPVEIHPTGLIEVALGGQHRVLRRSTEQGGPAADDDPLGDVMDLEPWIGSRRRAARKQVAQRDRTI